ncbi:MAG: class I SAM-dependent rRNA methyltransferase [Alphaproteobacteria bacterium]|nr:class I SAM-dependent rRNA methyltransferase [Alphaproteobacteria bacterium]
MCDVHPAIRLKPREGRRLRAGAPWVFSNEIVMDEAARALLPGSIVDLKGDDGKPLGTAYFNPRSLIAARLMDAGSGKTIDASFFIQLLKSALDLRAALYAKPFYRLVHAEGDFLPGLTIDRFGDTVVVQTATAGMEKLEAPIIDALDAVLAPSTVVFRNDVPARVLEGLASCVRTVRGDSGRILIEEADTRYFVEPATGQKTGWYYDQRDNRRFAASIAAGKSVLDAYCYSGGFALAAAHAGAAEVVGLDSSATALQLAEHSAAANRLSAKFIRCDVMEELERLGSDPGQFDIVLADPPPFVRARKDLEAGARAYRKLARLAANLVTPRGFLMLASCSHNMPADRFLAECGLGIARAGRRARLVRQAGAGPDHPIHPMLPETAYLKTLFFALD